MVALSPRYNDKMRRWGVRIAAQVHDEILFTGPWDILQDTEFQMYLRSELEKTTVEISVPILWDLGISNKCWAIAASDEGRISID
jgi:DNA polymerase I-like protein with 3'-5' exonuclease and polymerase domains